jgi:C-terminal processing protease CtpA/Prc
VVVRVAADSPAARGGMLVGDRIVMIDGVPLVDQDDMVRRLGGAGKRLTIIVDRRGRLVQLELDEDAT